MCYRTIQPYTMLTLTRIGLLCCVFWSHSNSVGFAQENHVDRFQEIRIRYAVSHDPVVNFTHNYQYVVLEKKGTEYSISLVRYHTMNLVQPAKEHITAIQPDEFVTVWNVAQRDNILDIQIEPQAQGRPQDGWGDREIVVEIRQQEEDELEQHELSWTQPLEDPTPVQPFLQELLTLANRYGKPLGFQFDERDYYQHLD